VEKLCAKVQHLSYNERMSSGWESKLVATATPELKLVKSSDKKKPTIEQLEAMRRKQNLALSRKKVLHELETAQNERYRELLHVTLADLDAQLAQFGD
jgi:hypothetical protein